MFLKFLASIAGTLGAYALYQILKFVIHELRSPLRHLPGPKSSSFLYGNFVDIWKSVIPFLNFWFSSFTCITQHNSVRDVHEEWVQQYGSTLKYKGFLGVSTVSGAIWCAHYLQTTRFYTTDTKALNHFLTNHYIYQRPEVSRYGLGRIVGPGVLVTEGDQHRQQVY